MAEDSGTAGTFYSVPDVVTWPPYSGDGAICMKCGYGSIDTRFVKCLCVEIGNGRHHWDRMPMGGISHRAWEHLHRECNRCGWSWDEAVAASA